MSEGKEHSSAMGSVWSVIPSVYYDMIARIAPGTLVLSAIGTFRTTIQTLESDSVRLLVSLGAGYVVGLLLTPFYFLTILPALGLTHTATISKKLELEEELPRNINDLVAEARPELGATLSKMQAEAVLCGNLVTGFAILVAFPIDSMLSPFKSDGCHGGLIWIGLVLWLAANYRYLMYYGRQIQAHKLITAPGHQSTREISMPP